MLINKSVDKILLIVDFRKIISDRIEELDVKQLQKRLKKAIETENYELAAQINERIKTLSNK